MSTIPFVLPFLEITLLFCVLVSCSFSPTFFLLNAGHLSNFYAEFKGKVPDLVQTFQKLISTKQK